MLPVTSGDLSQGTLHYNELTSGCFDMPHATYEADSITDMDQDTFPFSICIYQPT